MKQSYSAREVAEVLGVHRATIIRASDSGRIPFELGGRVGRGTRRLYRLEDVFEALRAAGGSK